MLLKGPEGAAIGVCDRRFGDGTCTTRRKRRPAGEWSRTK